jgi:hypothetical protein
MTRKPLIFMSLLLLFIVGVTLTIYQNNQTTSPPPETSPPPTQSAAPTPSGEQAETVGYGFILDFIAAAPPNANQEAQQNAYQALSANAQARVSTEAISRDLAAFMGLQDVPDQGASVEDLQIISENQATVIVGLNFSGGRVLRAVDLIVEDSQWKVDSIRPLEQYP